MRYYLCRDTTDTAIIWNIFQYDRIGTNRDIISYYYISQYFRAGTNVYAIPDSRESALFPSIYAPDSHSLRNIDITADFWLGIYYDTTEMPNIKPGSYIRRRMYLQPIFVFIMTP